MTELEQQEYLRLKRIQERLDRSKDPMSKIDDYLNRPKPKTFRLLYQVMYKKESIGKEYKYKKCAQNLLDKLIIKKLDIRFQLDSWISEIQIPGDCMSPKEYQKFLKTNHMANFCMNDHGCPTLLGDSILLTNTLDLKQFKRDEILKSLDI